MTATTGHPARARRRRAPARHVSFGWPGRGIFCWAFAVALGAALCTHRASAQGAGGARRSAESPGAAASRLGMRPLAQSDAPALRREIDVHFTRTPLDQVLRQIAQRGAIRLWYSVDVVGRDRLVSLVAEHITIANAFTAALAGTNLDLLVSEDGAQALVVRAGNASRSPAVAGRLIGTVVDASTGTGVVADVFPNFSSRSVRTDDAGRFVVDSLPVGDARLTVHAVGYATENVRVDVDTTGVTAVTVRMRAQPQALDPVRTRASQLGTADLSTLAVPSAVTVTGTQLSRVPSVVERDLMRSVALLPGVAARNDYSAGFNVRGGEADQTLILLDGVPIFNPFHLAGLFGTFIDGSIGRADVLTGGFPASYGGRLSGVLNVESAEERRHGVHGSGELSLLTSAVQLGGGIGDDKLSWNVALRRSYIDQVIAVSGAGHVPYYFRDGQLHVVSRVRGGGTLTATLYAGTDVLTSAELTDPETKRKFSAASFDWGNRIGGLTFRQPIGDRAVLSLTLSRSEFATHLDVPAETLFVAQNLGETRLAASLVRQLGMHSVTVGAEAAEHSSRYREQLVQGPLTERLFPDGFRTSGDTTIWQGLSARTLYLDDVWILGHSITLRGGIRGEYLPDVSWWGVSPRLSVRYAVTSRLAVTASGGRYTQWLHTMRNEDLPLHVFDLWALADDRIPTSSATHLILGIERQLAHGRLFRVEGYHKRYGALVEPSAVLDPRVRPELTRTFDGITYGADVYLRQDERQGFSGWLSYGYSVSVREREGVHYFAGQDRRHNANVVGSYAPGSHWRWGARLGVASGTPYTGAAGIFERRVYDPVDNVWRPGPDDQDGDQVRTARNERRYPIYSRLDVTVERHFHPWSVSLDPYLSVANLMNQKNVFYYRLNASSFPATLEPYRQFPILPSFGLRVSF